MDLPEDWRKASQRIIEKRGLVFILGGLDAGKTTFARYLAEEALNKGLKVGLIDSDVGQSTIGPPGTIGLSVMERNFQIDISSFYFVGDVSPRGHLLQTLIGTEEMVRKAKEEKCHLIIVDSCGMISYPYGYTLKYHKIYLLKPDFLITLGNSSEIELILQGLPPFFQHLPLKISEKARSTSREERRERRKLAFRRYFSQCFEHTFPFSELFFNPPILPSIDLSSLLVGLQGEGGDYLAVGIISEYKEEKEISIITPLEKKEKVKGITLGFIKVNLGGEELGRLNRNYFTPASSLKPAATSTPRRPAAGFPSKDERFLRGKDA